MCNKLTKTHLIFKISVLFIKIFSIGLIVLGIALLIRYDSEAKDLREAWNKNHKNGEKDMSHQKAVYIVAIVSVGCISTGALGLVAAFTLNLCLTIIFVVITMVVFLPMLVFALVYILVMISIAAAILIASLVIAPFIIAASVIISVLNGSKTLIPCI